MLESLSNFRAFKSAVSLKQKAHPNTDGKYSDFRAFKSAVSLKHEGSSLRAGCRIHFRAFKSAVSLKHTYKELASKVFNVISAPSKARSH